MDGDVVVTVLLPEPEVADAMIEAPAELTLNPLTCWANTGIFVTVADVA